MTGSDVPRSRADEKRGELGSVGVGGVLTIVGASFDGGVLGATFVSIFWIVPVWGRSGEATEAVWGGEGGILSGNIDPILDATLPRLPSAVLLFSFCNMPNPTEPGLRSGLVLGLGPRRGVRASLSLPTGEDDRFDEPLVGA